MKQKLSLTGEMFTKCLEAWCGETFRKLLSDPKLEADPYGFGKFKTDIKTHKIKDKN